MELDLWKPICVDSFNTHKYQYHYTTFETAIKIICTNSLLFSPTNNINNPPETKPKLLFQHLRNMDSKAYYKMVKELTTFFNSYTENTQILSFTSDVEISKEEQKRYETCTSRDEIYFDVSGRGFALPRMWMKYNKLKNGVCLIFNREKLISLVSKSVDIAGAGLVIYKKRFDAHVVNYSTMQNLLVKKSNLFFSDIIHNEEYLRYNFFEKIDDWSDEHEFRIVASNELDYQSKSRIRVVGVADSLAGIVISEDMDSSFENTLRLLARNSIPKCEMKRISFGNRIIKTK